MTHTLLVLTDYFPGWNKFLVASYGVQLMQNPSNLHPEMAEPIVQQVITDYVNAGLRLGLQPDWEEFKSSRFYRACAEKYPQARVDNLISIAMKTQFPTPPRNGVPTSTTGYVIRDYVNAGLAVGLSPDWDSFTTSQFYEACVKNSSKEETDKEVESARGFTDPLNKPLPPGFLGNK